MGLVNATGTHPTITRIRALLAERGISQSELARQLGWGRMQVQRRLSGDADLSVAELDAIAAVLGVPPQQLLTGEATA